MSFQSKPFQTSLGCAEVDIRNDTDDPVVIYPGEIICVTTNGLRRQGRLMVVDKGHPEHPEAGSDPGPATSGTSSRSCEALDISYVLWAR